MEVSLLDTLIMVALLEGILGSMQIFLDERLLNVHVPVGFRIVGRGLGLISLPHEHIMMEIFC